MILCSRHYCHPRFTDEETERLKNVARVTPGEVGDGLGKGGGVHYDHCDDDNDGTDGDR